MLIVVSVLIFKVNIKTNKQQRAKDQLVFEDVAIAVFGCSNIPPIDIDECCKKHGANVMVEILFDSICKDVFDF